MSENSVIVLVAGEEDLLNRLRDALSDTSFALLHAETKEEAIELLGRLKFEINLAIVELEMADYAGLLLVRQLTCLPNKPMKIIATTDKYPDTFFGLVKKAGVDAVVKKAIPIDAWRRTVETVLGDTTSRVDA